MGHRMNVAIFGIGRAGRIHIPNVVNNRQTYLKYLVDLDMSTLEATKEEFGLDKTQLLLTTDQDVVFNDAGIEGILICTTTHSHEQLVTKALNKGIAVFCEKPIAQTLEKITNCYKHARDKKGILHCSFNRRFDPSILEAKQTYRGKVGQVFLIKTVSRDSPVPPMGYLASSNGIFHDCGVHDLDLICWILGEWPTTVYSAASCFDSRIKTMDDFDVVSITLKFPSGIVANIDMTRVSQFGYDQRIEITGDQGMLRVENSSKSRVATFNSDGCHQSPIDYSFPQRYKESYVKSLDHFINVIKGKESPSVTGLECMNIAKLASLCEESCRLGKPLSFDPILSF